MRQCPTLVGEDRPLIEQSIQSNICMKRQRSFYHKCHRCRFRGKAADFEFETSPQSNGVVKQLLVEVLSDDAPARDELAGVDRVKE